MAAVRYTRNLFLRGVCIVYVFAFASFYLQIPGLYGSNGILPARTQMIVKGTNSLLGRIQAKPTLLWLAPYIGLDTEYMMDALALLGLFIAFAGFVTQKNCTAPVFSALWVLYFSLYQVGQTFMWFQWDILLLETGVLAILLAPVLGKGARADHPSDAVSFYMVRWLFFRLMFASGVVKLTSGCPTWWGLTALNVHFESQCIPTPLAWYAHHLPNWLLRLSTAGSMIVEILVPFLFFFPLRSVRVVAFFLQFILQVFIILSGNYNFFNVLTICLSLSLLDDTFFYKSRAASSRMSTIFSTLLATAVYGGVLYASVILFDLKLSSSGTIDSAIAFTQSEFDKALERGVPFSVYVGLSILVLTIAQAMTDSLRQLTSSLSKLVTFFVVILYSGAALVIFGMSLVPYTTLHPSGNSTVLPQVRTWYAHSEQFHITNSYGLFRRMTGVGGRPEVVIEGSNSLEGPWHEYNFLYKPGNINHTLPYVAPYQPRLDWQMWFAALGTYHQNPWLMSLTYRLLMGQPEVLQLLDNSRNPFPTQPPKYIKASLYHYHFTGWNQRWGTSWWHRERVSEYFPIFSRNHPPLLDYLRNMKIVGSEAKENSPNEVLKTVFNFLRSLVAHVEPSILLLSIFIAGCVLITTILSQPVHVSKSSKITPKKKQK